jgi:hypothetical protein
VNLSTRKILALAQVAHFEFILAAAIARDRSMFLGLVGVDHGHSFSGA